MENNFHKAIQAINERSRLHTESVQPLLEKANIFEGRSHTEEEVKSAIGHRLFIRLKRETDQMIEFIDDQANLLFSFITEMRNGFEKLYPKHQFLRVEKNPGVGNNSRRMKVAMLNSRP